MNTFLTHDELVELTGKKQPTAQRRVLDRNGIRYFVRGDGHNAVVRSQVDALDLARPTGPNLEALARLN